MKNGLIAVAAILVAGAGALFGWAYLRAQPHRTTFEACANDVIQASISTPSLLDAEIVRLDITDVSASASIADVVRVTLCFAHGIDDMGYRDLELAAGGQVRYRTSRSSLSPLAQEFKTGNPVFAFRKWPSILRSTDGSQAFGEWTGGILGVLSKELEDVNSAVRFWIEPLGIVPEEVSPSGL